MHTYMQTCAYTCIHNQQICLHTIYNYVVAFPPASLGNSVSYT